MAGIAWIHPNRPLARRFSRVLAAGYVKGADPWHLACALLPVADVRERAFVTLDNTQREVAARLGLS
jgi:hypothetical protein